MTIWKTMQSNKNKIDFCLSHGERNAKKCKKKKKPINPKTNTFSCAKQSILQVRFFNEIALKFSEIFFLRKTTLLSKMHHQLSLPS